MNDKTKLPPGFAETLSRHLSKNMNDHIAVANAASYLAMDRSIMLGVPPMFTVFLLKAMCDQQINANMDQVIGGGGFDHMEGKDRERMVAATKDLFTMLADNVLERCEQKETKVRMEVPL